MELSFPWPASGGEWLAWSSAVATVAVGLFAMFMPRLALRFFRLAPAAGRQPVLVLPRAVVGGFHVGFGLVAILLAQPFVYLALGVAWGAAAFGAVVSLLSDGAGTLYGWAFLVLALVLATLPLGYILGFPS